MKSLAEFTVLSDYQTFSKARFKSLAEIGEPVFISVDAVDFDKWSGNAVLVGDKGAALQKILKKDIKFREGTCVVRGKTIYVSELSGGLLKAANKTLKKLGIDYDFEAGAPPASSAEKEFEKLKGELFPAIKAAVLGGHPESGRLKKVGSEATSKSKEGKFEDAVAVLQEASGILDKTADGEEDEDVGELTLWRNYLRYTRAQLKKIKDKPVPFFMSKKRVTFLDEGGAWDGFCVLAGPKARAAMLEFKKAGAIFVEGTSTANGKTVIVEGVPAAALKHANKTLKKMKIGWVMTTPTGEGLDDEDGAAAGGAGEAEFRELRDALFPRIKEAVQSGAHPSASELRNLAKTAADAGKAGRFDEAVDALRRAGALLDGAPPSGGAAPPPPEEEEIAAAPWSKKKKEEPPKGTPYRTPADPARTAAVITRLRDLTLRAERNGITLKGTLPEKRQVVIKAMDVDDYARAEKALDGIERELVAVEAEHAKWAPASGPFATMLQQIEQLVDFGAPEAVELATKVRDVQASLTSELYGQAVSAAKALAQAPMKIGAILAMYPARGEWWLRTDRVEATKRKVTELEGWNAPEAGGFRTRLDALLAEATDERGKYDTAVPAFDALEGEVETKHASMRDERADYDRDRPLAEAAVNGLTGHAEVGSVRAEVDALVVLQRTATEKAAANAFKEANVALTKILTDAPKVRTKADEAGKARAASLKKKKDWADAKIKQLEAELAKKPAAVQKAYKVRLDEMKRQRDEATKKLTPPQHDFRGADDLSGKVFFGCDNAIRSFATFDADYPAYEKARAAAVKLLDPLKAHAQKDAIRAEIEAIEKALEAADLVGSNAGDGDAKSSWKKAIGALKPIKGMCDDALKLAESIGKISSKVDFEEEFKKRGVDEATAKELGSYALSLMAAEKCSIQDAIKMARETKAYREKGMSENEAKLSSRTMHALTEDGTDEDLARAVGENIRGLGTAKVEDMVAVANSVKGLPRAIIDNFNANGINTVACRGPITDMAPHLAGEPPRGWPAGSTWDQVPGVYLGSEKRVVAGTIADEDGDRKVPEEGEGHGSFNLVGHEAGHGFDVSDPGPKKNTNKAFRSARDKDKKRGNTASPHGLVGGVDNYFLTKAEGGTNDAGAISETFAESCAHYAGNSSSAWPNLKAFWDKNPWIK